MAQCVTRRTKSWIDRQCAAKFIGSFVILSFIPGVAWQAHLGGLLVGALTGYFIKNGR